ncbi:response regulator transcription factor [Zoogloea sp.]|uniref:response regulator transcription factor n=1 Tax=Zoogloea sp. TaxID=49181 RepID=UPI0031FCA3F9
MFADALGLTREAREEDFQLFLLDQQIREAEVAFQWLQACFCGGASIIFYNCDDNESRLADALEQGADDYITAARGGELVARCCALLRRREGGVATRRGLIELPPYRFEVISKQAFVEGRRVELTDKEFELSVFFFRNPGRLLSREKLLEVVWGGRLRAASRTVDTHVSRIRRKLDIHPGRGFRLSASYGSGYRLERVEDPSSAVLSHPDLMPHKFSHPP